METNEPLSYEHPFLCAMRNCLILYINNRCSTHIDRPYSVRKHHYTDNAFGQKHICAKLQLTTNGEQ